MSLRVFVVDDAAIFRRIISEALAGLPAVEVVGTSSNGKLALSRLQALQPDLLTVDIEMPEMNGIELLEALAKAGSKAGAIVLSSVTRRGSEMTMRALELGAFDFITKPEADSPAEAMLELRNRLAPMVREFARRREAGSNPTAFREAPKAASLPNIAPQAIAPPVAPRLAGKARGAPLVLIGVSTGGPAALGELLPRFPARFSAPVFIVQHMPPLFTEALAQNLRSKCALGVREATEGETALPGIAYIAPGGRHMKIVAGPRGEILIKLTGEPPENNCRPAVDVLFASAALHFPGRSVAAILTGMGQDGTRGLRMLKRGGCFSIAQDEASSVVFGMPRAAIEAGLVDSVLPLSGIASALIQQIDEAQLAARGSGDLTRGSGDLTRGSGDLTRFSGDLK